MDGDDALSFAVGAVTLYWDALFFAFGLLFVEGRGESHLEANGSAMAVEVVICVDAIWFCPGWFDGWSGPAFFAFT